LEMVNVQAEQNFQSVYVKTGRRFNDKIEILSGLNDNDTIGY